MEPQDAAVEIDDHGPGAVYLSLSPLGILARMHRAAITIEGYL